MRPEKRGQIIALIRAAALGHAMRSEQFHQTHLDNDRAFFGRETLGESPRVSQMIGVIVRDDNARDRLAAHCAAEVLLPDCARRFNAETGVDGGPAPPRSSASSMSDTLV